MKAGKIILHVLASAMAAALLVGVPSAYIIGQSDVNTADAVSGASVKLPEKPSGEYVLLLNRTLHEDSLDDWIAFFRDGELNVIFDDISCIAAQSDSGAIQMAQRLQAQLPENQMQLRTENPMLLVSKAENGCIDAAIFSKEMADSLGLKAEWDGDVAYMIIKGGEDENEKG